MMQVERWDFSISDDLFRLEGRDVYVIAVYAAIKSFCSKEMTAFPSYQTIADMCSISRPKAITTVAQLEEMGLLTKQVRYRSNSKENTSNLYTVNDPHRLAGSKRDLPPSKPDLPPPSKPDLPPSKHGLLEVLPLNSNQSLSSTNEQNKDDDDDSAYAPVIPFSPSAYPKQNEHNNPLLAYGFYIGQMELMRLRGTQRELLRQWEENDLLEPELICYLISKTRNAGNPFSYLEGIINKLPLGCKTIVDYKHLEVAHERLSERQTDKPVKKAMGNIGRVHQMEADGRFDEHGNLIQRSF